MDRSPRQPVRALRRRAAALLLLTVACLGAGAHAADVEVKISSREVYTDIPFSITIAIADASEFETPVIPAVDGLTVLGAPSRSTQSFTSIVNGRSTRHNTVNLSYSLVASKPGRLTIPPITVLADGDALRTAPFAIDVVRPDAGDLIFAEITADDEEVFQGEAVDLTLRIWIKPYEDAQLSGPLNSETMWSLLDLNRSAWGEFVEPVRDMIGQLGSRRRLAGKRVIRDDADGAPALYYLYEVAVRIWPQQTGPLEVKPVVLMMQYPLSLRRSRSVFSRGDLEIAGSRTLVARAEPRPVSVIPPPAAGRPPWYRGAVGRFEIAVDAQPTTVAVGDPVTLTLRITDRTRGGGRLELLQPPPLGELPELTTDFKVPTDPLAGVVDRNTKVFTQTIRARNEEVSVIPAIPFAAFDPDLERYVTAMSDPIPIQVSPASTMAITDVVGANGANGPGATELTEVAGGILANATGADELLRSHVFAPGWIHLATLLAPPFLYLGALLAQRRVRRLRHDDGYARRRGARRNAIRRLAAVDRGPEAVRAETVVLALSDYVADRVGAPSGALTRVEAIERLQRSDVDPSLLAEVAELLEECERARYARDANGAADGVTERARRCVDRLEREKIR